MGGPGVDELDARLRAAGSPERAEQESRYLHSAGERVHYGVPVPAVRALGREAARQRLGPRARRGPDDAGGRAWLLAAVARLWDEPAGAVVHERRLLAAVLLTEGVGTLTAADLPLVERLLRQARTWALVDVLASDVAGPLLERVPDRDGVLDRWAADDDFWLRRSALLAPLRALRAGGGDLPGFLRRADGLLADREFFVRKAIGWVLRDTSRRRPEEVGRWLLPRAARASGVTVREAVKHLPEGVRASVLAARTPPRGAPGHLP